MVLVDSSRRVVVNADDFGVSPGVNRAIAACFEAGSVSSATLVVNGAASEGAALIAESMERLGVGLHFNLTLGRPLSHPGDVGSLLGAGGGFASRPRLLVRWLLGRLDVDHVRRELAAQVTKFADLGLDMTHIDSHQHVHMIPPVFRVVARHCRSRRLPMRMPWLRPTNPVRPGVRRRARMTLLSALIRRNAHDLGRDLKTNKEFASVFDVCDTPDQVSESVYADLLDSIDVFPFELMVHPALVDDSLRNLTTICDFSEREYRILSEIGFDEMSSKKNLKLVNYREAVLDSTQVRKAEG